MEDPKALYFRNDKHTFKAIISKNFSGYFIKIGGTYNCCLEIQYKPSDNTAKIIQIKSERECGLIKFLEEGDTVPMIKASLQSIASIFPIKQFDFDDGSSIECGEKNMNSKPPRRTIKPLSLLHLSIALSGLTWYEKYFNAKMNPINRDIYKKCIETYMTSPMIPYDTFKMKYLEYEKQSIALEPYYLAAKSYPEFFTSVPKNRRCELFFNWVPTFINSYFNSVNLFNNWYINIDDMPTIPIEILGSKLPEGYKGGRRNRTIKNSKRKKNTIVFSNDRNAFLNCLVAHHDM